MTSAASVSTSPITAPTADEVLTPLGVPSPDQLAALPDDELAEAIVTHSVHLAVESCRFLLLLAEFDRREGWGGDHALKSCAHWLSWRCAMSLVTAREHVRVARALRDLPRITQTFASGRLTYSKVRALVRVATSESEQSLVELALEATASQLERICKAYRTVLDQGDSPLGFDPSAMAAHRRRSLRHWSTDHGTVVIRAELPTDDAALLLGAIEAMTDRLERHPEEPEAGPPDDSAESSSAESSSAESSTGAASFVEGELVSPDTGRTRSQARADALLEMAETALAADSTLTEERYRPVVALHVDDDVLREDRPADEGCCYLQGLGTIGVATARRLACDARIRRYRATADGVLDLVGSTRETPLRLRRALHARDGGCRFPGCTNRRFLHAHHVVFVEHEGPTELSNLVLLCRFHHRLVHDGGYRLHLGDDGSVAVQAPDGREVPNTPAPARRCGPSLVERHRRAGFAPSSDDVPLLGEPFDLELTIDALMCQERRRGRVRFDPFSSGRGRGWSGTSPPPC